MSTCYKCEELNKIIKIKLPEDLKFVIRLAKQKQSENILSVVEDSNEEWDGNSTDFYAITKNDWSDMIVFEFKCNFCGQRFKLSCETYHGGGGEWKPIS